MYDEAATMTRENDTHNSRKASIRRNRETIQNRDGVCYWLDWAHLRQEGEDVPVGFSENLANGRMIGKGGGPEFRDALDDIVALLVYRPPYFVVLLFYFKHLVARFVVDLHTGGQHLVRLSESVPSPKRSAWTCAQIKE